MKAEGFEPSTACLEGRCSIQLSYASIYLLKLKWKKFNLSGWQDSNLRPPAPKAGAITELRYTPKKNYNSGETGTRTLAPITRWQFSKLLHYHSGTSPSSKKRVLFCGCKLRTSLHYTQVFWIFFLFFFVLLTKTLHNQTYRIKINLKKIISFAKIWNCIKKIKFAT